MDPELQQGVVTLGAAWNLVDEGQLSKAVSFFERAHKELTRLVRVHSTALRRCAG